MYVTTAKTRVVALDAATGKQIWRFDGGNGRAMHPNRGVTYWTDGSQTRILVTIGHDLLSIDAKTGKLALDFGNQGKVDLRTAFDRPIEDISLTVTTPGTIYKDLIILGSSVSENLPATPGIFALTTCARVNCAGRSIHSASRRIGNDTWPPNACKTRAPLTTGRAWRWTTSADQSMFPPVPQRLILRSRPSWRQSLSQYTALPGCGHGKAQMASPGSTPRRSGSQLPSAPTLITIRHQGHLSMPWHRRGKPVISTC